MKARGRRPSAFIVFECLKPRWNTKHEFLKLLLQQKKISLNYHLNKFSQFNYYILDVKYAWTSKRCVWCAWSYHLIAALWQFLNIQQLRSRYLAVCQFRGNTLLRKQMVECRFRPRKTSEEEEKCVASASATLNRFKHGFQTRPCFQLVFHWVSKPIHLTRIRCSGWVRASSIINEFENTIWNLSL